MLVVHHFYKILCLKLASSMPIICKTLSAWCGYWLVSYSGFPALCIDTDTIEHVGEAQCTILEGLGMRLYRC